jgi:hypothetical protein
MDAGAFRHIELLAGVACPIIGDMAEGAIEHKTCKARLQ